MKKLSFFSLVVRIIRNVIVDIVSERVRHCRGSLRKKKNKNKTRKEKIMKEKIIENCRQ